MTDSIIVVVTGIINLLLGGVVLVRNPRNVVNRLFAALSVSLITWTSFNFLADQAPSNNLLYTRLTFAAAILIAASLYQLSNVFPNGRPLNGRKLVLFEAIAAITMVGSSLSPLLVPSVTKLSGTGVELEVGPLYYLYIVYILHILILIVRNFRKKHKSAASTERAQISLLILGVLFYAVSAIISNLILPLVVDSWSSSRYGPIFTLLFVAFTAYAIIKHRLMDIRLIVARSLAYILLFSTLFTAYALILFLLSTTVFSGGTSEKIAPIIAALLIGFTVQPLRKQFDRLTNKYFYRDAYDAQAFLDDLNKELVSNADLEALLNNISSIITDNLKAEFCLFGLKETSYSPQRIIGTKQKHFDEEDILAIRAATPKMHRTVIVADMLDENDEFHRKLRKYDVAILARLTSDVEREIEGLGYLILGQKKSGNPYTKQDAKIVEIIANELVIAVQNSLRFEEIEKFNITLQDKVDEATRKLRRTNEKLKALDETKDEFISMASHQLRTPLTSVKGYLSMVLEGDAGNIPPMQRKLLDQAFVSSQRMVYLIADLLNVSRLRTGKFVIESVESNLADVVEGEIGQLKETAAGRGLELSYEKPDNFPTLYLDETKIRQVIMNFTDNAIYYTPKGGHIVVKLEDKPESIELTVNDDGMGVPKSEQPHLFTKFYRAGNAQKARPDGTGLGLFMAKKVIVAQGGSLIFTSQEGKGSTFGFSFPKSKLQRPFGVDQTPPPTK